MRKDEKERVLNAMVPPPPWFESTAHKKTPNLKYIKMHPPYISLRKYIIISSKNP